MSWKQILARSGAKRARAKPRPCGEAHWGSGCEAVRESSTWDDGERRAETSKAQKKSKISQE